MGPPHRRAERSVTVARYLTGLLTRSSTGPTPSESISNIGRQLDLHGQGSQATPRAEEEANSNATRRERIALMREELELLERLNRARNQN